MIASAKSKFLLGSIFFAFFSYGLFAAVTGSLSVPIMDFYAIDSAQRGFMITLQGLGGLLMVLFSMFFGDRFNKFGLFLAGLVLMSATGLFLASKPSLALFMLLLFLWGGGIMLVDTISNSLIADNFRRNQDRYVPYLHLSYGIGIFISNAVTKLILDHIHVQAWAVVYWVFGLVGALAGLIFLTAVFLSRKSSPYRNPDKKDARFDFFSFFKMPVTWKILASMFMFASFLHAVMYWLPYHWEKVLGFDKGLAVLSVSIFFAGTLAMRFISPWLLKKYSPQQLIFTGSICGGICMILGIYLPSLWAAAILTVLAGFFTGGNIPFFAILALKTYSNKSSFASSLVILALTLAMFVFPGFVGEMAKLFNMTFALTIACFCPLICAPLILSVKT